MNRYVQYSVNDMLEISRAELYILLLGNNSVSLNIVNDCD